MKSGSRCQRWNLRFVWSKYEGLHQESNIVQTLLTSGIKVLAMRRWKVEQSYKITTDDT
jgi:hypothetical protein